MYAGSGFGREMPGKCVWLETPCERKKTKQSLAFCALSVVNGWACLYVSIAAVPKLRAVRFGMF